jgi:hypothetical protein
MSEEKVEIVREAIDAFNRRDLDAFVARAVGRNDGWPDEPRKFDGQTSAQPVSFGRIDGGCRR